ncbi:MAG: hypothetical protein II886_07535 [Prevotella sp.]|nr:hypothetical protein [Prevotella sp.]
MFCYQRSFGFPTEVVTLEQFRALTTAPRTVSLVREAREALARGDKKTYGARKKGLPFVVFIATYDESEKVFENKDTGEKTKKSGHWRNQKFCRLNGLCVIDFDHVDSLTPTPSPNGEGSKKTVREIWADACARLSDEDKARILLVYVTPSGHGLKVVFTADATVGNLIDNQKAFSAKLGLNPDEACKDASRGAFLTTSDDIIFIDEERLITYENEEFGKKYNAEYHAGHSAPTKTADVADTKAGQGAETVGTVDNQGMVTYHNVPYQQIVAAWVGDKKIEQGDRHRTSLVLADHLRYITDNDAKLIEQILRETPFVREIIEERGEDVAQTVKSAQGYEFLKGIPKRMQQALKSAGALSVESSKSKVQGNSSAGADNDVYAMLPLEAWAEELQETAQHYPCMRELFLNVHPHKLAAVLFSSAALFGTLMTRAWYHFWYEPEHVRRLNYCIFIIGDPGAGKNVIEKFYKKIADPMIQADQCLIDAVNRYKDGRTERTTSTKAQKGEALKKPVVGIRVHPARTATGEFIRHMLAAVETIQGMPLNLHMFSFDAELDNVTKQNKGGDWKDREILELKAFHNEQDGQMYANQESVTGMFNVFWNFIYTGTPYALHRKVNQRNFGTGMSTRLAVIPLPDKGMAQRHQQVDPSANETLQTWAYRLDKVEGELPIEPLNDETYEWQSSRLEIAEFNDDKADRTLLKRIPYYGIGISLPFILMRHWDEWQEHRTLTMDDRDRRLCRLAMEIQYRCQQFYFGEMAYNYFADQNKEFVQRRRTTRYDDCFRKLPDEFKTQQFKDCFHTNDSATSRALKRLKADGLIEKLSYGVYRKLVQELP